MRPDEPAQRARAERVEILGGPGLRRDQPHREMLRAGAQPDTAEIGVLGPALPQPGPLAGDHDPPEGGRQRARPLKRVPLRPGGPSHLAPDLAKVTQVIAALAVQPDFPVSSATDQLPDGHAAHAHAHRTAAHPAEGTGPGPGHHRDHAERHGQHRHVGEHLLQSVSCHFRDLRRRLERDLAARHVRRLAPLLTRHNDGAHRLPSCSLLPEWALSGHWPVSRILFGAPDSGGWVQREPDEPGQRS
jgi:hypothetical protein